MTYKLFRWVGAVWTVVLFMAMAASELLAIDSKGRSFAYGVGQRSCEDYVKFREKRLETLEKHERYTKDELYEIVDKIVEHWIAGFLTAHNFYVADTYDVAGKSGMDDLKARLEKSCRSNPKQLFAEVTTREKGAGIGTLAGAGLGAIIGSATGNAGAALIGDQMQSRQKQEQDLQQQMAAQQAQIEQQQRELNQLKAQQAR